MARHGTASALPHPLPFSFLSYLERERLPAHVEVRAHQRVVLGGVCIGAYDPCVYMGIYIMLGQADDEARRLSA